MSMVGLLICIDKGEIVNNTQKKMEKQITSCERDNGTPS